MLLGSHLGKRCNVETKRSQWGGSSSRWVNKRQQFSASCTAAGSLDRRSPAFLEQNIPKHQGPVVGCICLDYESRAAILRCIYQFTMFQTAALLLPWGKKKGRKGTKTKVLLTLDVYEICLHGMKTRQPGDTLPWLILGLPCFRQGKESTPFCVLVKSGFVCSFH